MFSPTNILIHINEANARAHTQSIRCPIAGSGRVVHARRDRGLDARVWLELDACRLIRNVSKLEIESTVNVKSA